MEDQHIRLLSPGTGTSTTAHITVISCMRHARPLGPSRKGGTRSCMYIAPYVGSNRPRRNRRVVEYGRGPTPRKGTANHGSGADLPSGRRLGMHHSEMNNRAEPHRPQGPTQVWLGWGAYPAPTPSNASELPCSVLCPPSSLVRAGVMCFDSSLNWPTS